MIIDTIFEIQIDTRKDLQFTSNKYVLRSTLLSKLILRQHLEINLVYHSCFKQRQG